MKKLNIIFKHNLIKLQSILFLSLITPGFAIADPYNSTIDLFESSPNVKPFLKNLMRSPSFQLSVRVALGLVVPSERESLCR